MAKAVHPVDMASLEGVAREEMVALDMTGELDTIASIRVLILTHISRVEEVGYRYDCTPNCIGYNVAANSGSTTSLVRSGTSRLASEM